MDLKGKKVFVGLSGGVDSAVTAALLQKEGADITGVFIKGWYPPGMPCTWADDRRDAMRVAAHLRIPFHTLDASAEYKEGVIDYLLSEYKAGRTPNPDIMCNREVKFGAFYEFAMRNGADFIATGHYARAHGHPQDVSSGWPSPAKPHPEEYPAAGHTRLLRGVDESKDQSYFLWAISKEALDHSLFPLGGMHKSEVRELAKKFELPVAEKKDSQGICFLGSISVEDFLREEFHPEEGLALDADGKEIGKHDGAVLHTLGERIPLRNAAPGPWYVIQKDMAANTVTVAHELQPLLHLEQITLQQTNWLSEVPSHVEAQYRYHGPRITGSLTGDIFTPSTPLEEPIASGQSLVLYDGDVCIGGGIIA